MAISFLKKYFADALVFYCTETNTECVNVQIEQLNKSLGDDFKTLVLDEYRQIENYVSIQIHSIS